MQHCVYVLAQSIKQLAEELHEHWIMGGLLISIVETELVNPTYVRATATEPRPLFCVMPFAIMHEMIREEFFGRSRTFLSIRR